MKSTVRQVIDPGHRSVGALTIEDHFYPLISSIILLLLLLNIEKSKINLF
jgi:hypothetical protein